jgi:asparagine synthase (glutamine-hydrolysing)
LVDWTLWHDVAALAAASRTFDKRGMATTLQKALPAAVLNRPKTGFHVPTREWMQEPSAGRGRGRGLRGWAQFVYGAAAAA